jgi:methionyl-tRNA formyltransferase
VSSRLRIVFAGTPDFAVPALDAVHAAGHELAAVYTQPDRPAGRGRTLTASPVKRRAHELDAPLEQPASLKGAESAERLRSHAPDLMVVVAYGLILPPAILSVPRHGCWNIHASLLPRWRGAAPIQRAIEAGDAETGITIMRMDAGLDTGPMLLTRATPIGASESGGSLHDRLARIGAACVVEAIEAWQAGRIVAVEQPATGVTYAAKIAKEEARLDWSRPAAELERKVRAFNPWPVAQCRWVGKQLRVWEAESMHASTVAVAPGTVLDSVAGRIVVATGEGALALKRVQVEGRRAMTATEFLNAHALAGVQLA